MNTPLTDNQLQQLLEMGRPLPPDGGGQNADAFALYQRVFAELEQGLPLKASPDFAARITAQLEPYRPAPTGRVAYGWLVVGLMLCLLTGAFVLVPLKAEAAELWRGLVSIKPFVGLLLFGLGSLLTWQLLDWKLVREPALQL